MADVLGPADAPFAVTVRPPEDRTFSTLDSWFKDCSGPNNEDGTEIHANVVSNILEGIYVRLLPSAYDFLIVAVMAGFGALVQARFAHIFAHRFERSGGALAS